MSRSWKDLCDTTTRVRGGLGVTLEHSPTLSSERATAILDDAEDAGLRGMSKINPALTRSQMHEVLRGGVPTEGGPLLSVVSMHIIREFRKQAKAIAMAEGSL